jgi:SAM-dependent methyltransferase
LHYEDENYFLTTEMSKSQQNYQNWLYQNLREYWASPIAEIGPGDGYFGLLLSKDYNYTGFEPASKSYGNCLKKGLNVIKDYFYPDKYKCRFKTIVARQVFEHIEDTNKFLQNVYSSLDIDGIAVFEVPNIEKARKLNRTVDFCPEHLNYFTMTSLALSFSANGFEVEKLQKTFEDEYLLIVARKRGQFIKFKADLDFSHMVFYGAGSRGVSLCHYLKAKPKYIVDSDPNKIGRYIPGTSIPVKDLKYMLSDKSCKAVLVTGFFYFNEIQSTLRQSGFDGEIYGINENGELVKCLK